MKRRVLIMGGGDMGSAIAHRLFHSGFQVLICDRPQSPHARRGMAYTDALFDGHALLDGLEARTQADLDGVQSCWEGGEAIPIVTLPENLLTAAIRFDVIVDATMRRNREPADLRTLARVAIGLGPGYCAGQNCHVAIETQWGPSMGQVLRDRAAAEREGGPPALDGVSRERFAVSPATGTWRTAAVIGQAVQAGDWVGSLDHHRILAPISGLLRGVARDGAQVIAGHRVLEIDPRAEPQVFGLGERPLAVAAGVVEALRSLETDVADAH